MEEVQVAPSQVRILKTERKWLGEHAEYRAGWYCKKTGAEILMVPAVHSIWQDGPGPCAGDGETQTVFHLYCPDCEKEPEFEYGSPVQADDLMFAQNG
ncbi:MAG: hypothetical protein ABSE68_02175 [Minisyncoccia bacterium]